MFEKIFLIIFITLSFSSYSQDIKVVRNTIDTLCSPFMGGRGYVDEGDKRAANYLQSEYTNIGLKKFEENYFQKFNFDINTFSKRLFLKSKTKKYKLGEDFISAPFSANKKGKAKVIYLDSILFNNEGKVNPDFLNVKLKKSAIVMTDETFGKIVDLPGDYIDKINTSKCIIRPKTKLTASLSTLQYPQTYFDFVDSLIPAHNEKIKFRVDAELQKNYESQNVVGYVEGTEYPDSFFVFSAHYDHLGKMGNVYFPGANDNASGTAMMLELAKYYQKNPLKFSIAFIGFGAEEAGLIGSQYFVEHSLIPLKKIKFVMNIDLMASGEKGITVVNGKIFTKDYDRLTSINEKESLLPLIKSRGEAMNSDHYYFSKNGVPAFFVYAMGGTTAYHDIFDTPEKLPLTEFKDIMKLFQLFFEQY